VKITTECLISHTRGILTEGEGSVVDLLNKVAYFVKKLNNSFNMKRSRYKLVRTRRSTVLNLSLQ
jgi:hypothetical protein